MTCSCIMKNAKPQGGDEMTMPGEQCLSCAYKHISTAFACYVSRGFGNAEDTAVQIGELECARRHLVNSNSGMNELVCRLENSILSRDSGSSNAMFDAAISCAEDALGDGKTQAGGSHFTEDMSSAKYSEKTAIESFIYLSCAWRLFNEPGYFKQNRAMTIGSIAMSQWHLSGIDMDAAIRMRELRHSIQRGDERHVSQKLFSAFISELYAMCILNGMTQTSNVGVPVEKKDMNTTTENT